MTSSRLSSVARPKQARSERTLQRLLDAAEALLIERGAANVSIPDIVARAESSVGGFYARFRDKDELIRALEERFLSRMSATYEAFTAPERWRDANVEQIVRASVAEIVRNYGRERQLMLAFFARAAREQEPWLEGVRLRRRVARRLGDMLLARRDELNHPDPEVAVDLGLTQVFALLQQKVIFGEVRAGGGALDDERLVSELATSLLSYLGVSCTAAGVASHRED